MLINVLHDGKNHMQADKKKTMQTLSENSEKMPQQDKTRSIIFRFSEWIQ